MSNRRVPIEYIVLERDSQWYVVSWRFQGKWNGFYEHNSHDMHLKRNKNGFGEEEDKSFCAEEDT